MRGGGCVSGDIREVLRWRQIPHDQREKVIWIGTNVFLGDRNGEIVCRVTSQEVPFAGSVGLAIYASHREVVSTVYYIKVILAFQ